MIQTFRTFNSLKRWPKPFTLLLLLTTSLLAQQAGRPEELNLNRWAISGYLDNGEKTYVIIQNQKIESLSKEKPTDISDDKIQETEDWITPGFIDLHNHLSYSILPLWMNALGQFDNRFEWRDQKIKKIVGYDDATSLQMTPFNPRPVGLTAEQRALAERASCAAIRWAEIKALVGGETVIQGYTGESLSFPDVRGRGLSCAASYLLPNVEIQSDLPELPSIRSKTDIVDDLASWGVNEPFIYPLMKNENLTYDEALKKVLQEKGFTDWAADFNSFPRSVANGLRLTLARDLPSSWTWLESFESAENIPPRTELEAHRDDLYKFFTDVLHFKEDGERPNKLDQNVDKVIGWIYGPRSSDSTSFLKSKPGTDKVLQDQLARSTQSGGIYRIRFVIQDFVADFYYRVYLPLLRDKQQENFRMIAHLAEGNPDHALTKREFKDVVKMGLAFDKSIIIHGVGMDEEDLTYAKDHEISFVWSPLSNLLLYGGTVNVPNLIKKGINVSLGPDWAATGSKSILYELKAARAIFDKWISQGKLESFSNKELLALVTSNPAKALSMENLLGTIAPGAYANFLIVKKQSTNLYDDILNSTENELKLSVVTGIPRSGESEWMIKLLSPFKESLEDLSTFTSCVKNKMIFMKDPNDLDQKLLSSNQNPLDTLAGISKTVHEARERQRANASPANLAKLKDIDPLFDCDSPEARARLNEVISNALPADETSLAAQKQRRRDIRRNSLQDIGDTWKSKYQNED